MSKKKPKKEINSKGFDYQNEVSGIVFILIAIIGLKKFGPIGTMFHNFAVFLVGNFASVLLLLLLIIGVYLIIKRDYPKFFTARLIGIYIIMIAVFTLAHLDFVTVNSLKGFDIFKETINEFMVAIKTSDINTGGGIVGALTAYIFVSLLSVDGTKIVSFVLILLGIIICFNISILDGLKWIKNKIKLLFKHPKKADVSVKDMVNPEDKTIITSVDCLTHVNDKKEEPITNEVLETSLLSKGNDKYTLPPLELLDNIKQADNIYNINSVKNNIAVLESVLHDFDVHGKVVSYHIGPSVTQYELELQAGTKVNKILGLNRELALSLAARDIRIQAPIPGKNTVGVEIPNKVNIMVGFKEIINNIPNNIRNNKLAVALGKDIMGRPIFAEIDKTPHLLVAGSTGSGKSVCINSIIISILMRATKDEVRLVMIDPKKVELSNYNGIPHLLDKVITDPKKASIALKNIVNMMDERYELFSQTGSKNITSYNDMIDKNNRKSNSHDQKSKLPYIVVIIDELADLMLVAAKEVEDSILRLTQMARAAGIHLIVATQRPSTDVITGVVKANIPSRISFSVSSSIDSRTILDMTGAEKLLGKGDMLFLPMGENIPIRIQGAFISDDEINRVIEFLKDEMLENYDTNLTKMPDREGSFNRTDDEEYEDPLYNEIVDFVIKAGHVSASALQRKYRLGYNRAARIIDLLEERGIIGPSNGSKPREVLYKLDDH